MNITKTLRGGLALALLLAACGDDKNTPIDAPRADSAPNIDSGPQPVVYKQVEQLARPGINEAFLFTEAYNAGYNATAPSFAGADAAAVAAITAEAKTVMKALYLGACLLNGAAGLTTTTGLHPAGMTCNAVGGALWTENSLAGVTLTAGSIAAAQAYADKVFSQFIPDVMRIDTAVASSYLTLCGDATSTPLLCGGRNLNDDVIDVTYDYLLAGAAVTSASPDQFRALVSDGVVFSKNTSENLLSVSTADVTNPNQFHPSVSATFPYSAAPF